MVINQMISRQVGEWVCTEPQYTQDAFEGGHSGAQSPQRVAPRCRRRAGCREDPRREILFSLA